MNYSPFIAFDLVYAVIAVLSVAASVLLVVLLVRLILAATRALNAFTLDRTVRLDLFLADDTSDNDTSDNGSTDTDGSTPA